MGAKQHLPPRDPETGNISETTSSDLSRQRVAESSDDLSLPTFLIRDHPEWVC
jgi:hypothetical protein